MIQPAIHTVPYAEHRPTFNAARLSAKAEPIVIRSRFKLINSSQRWLMARVDKSLWSHVRAGVSLERCSLPNPDHRCALINVLLYVPIVSERARHES